MTEGMDTGLYDAGEAEGLGTLVEAEDEIAERKWIG